MQVRILTGYTDHREQPLLTAGLTFSIDSPKEGMAVLLRKGCRNVGAFAESLWALHHYFSPREGWLRSGIGTRRLPVLSFLPWGSSLFPGSAVPSSPSQFRPFLVLSCSPIFFPCSLSNELAFSEATVSQWPSLGIQASTSTFPGLGSLFSFLKKMCL